MWITLQYSSPFTWGCLSPITSCRALPTASPPRHHQLFAHQRAFFYSNSRPLPEVQHLEYSAGGNVLLTMHVWRCRRGVLIGEWRFVLFSVSLPNLCVTSWRGVLIRQAESGVHRFVLPSCFVETCKFEPRGCLFICCGRIYCVCFVGKISGV